MISQLQDEYQFDESSHYSEKSNESSENNSESNEREFKDQLSDIGYSRVTKDQVFSHIAIKITIKTTIKSEIKSKRDQE